jgi:RHS repeat-associated protein
LALSFGAAKERAFTSRRVYKKDVVNSVTTEVLYLHDGMNAIVERNKTGTPTEYIYGPTGLLAVKNGSAWNFVLKDHLGSTRVVVDQTNVVQASYEYAAFGNLIAYTGTNGTTYRFTGQEWDQTSGLHNFKARMYDSDLAMFYGTDPARQFSSPFTYASNNPLIYRDPDGKFIWAPVIVGAILGGYMGGTQAHMQGKNVWKGIFTGGISGAAGGTVGAVLGPVNGIVSSGIYGAVSGGVSGGIYNALNGKNVLQGAKGSAISGGISAAAFATLDLLSGIGNEKANNVTAKKGDAEIKDPLFIEKALHNMEAAGGTSGRNQARLIKQYETEFVYDKSVSLGRGSLRPKRFWQDKVFGKLFFKPQYVGHIRINPWHIFDETYLADDWAAAGIAPNDWPSKTAEVLYHESGHMFGIHDAVGRYYTVQQLDHPPTWQRNMWDDTLGEITFNWIKNEYLVNMRR